MHVDNESNPSEVKVCFCRHDLTSWNAWSLCGGVAVLDKHMPRKHTVIQCRAIQAQTRTDTHVYTHKHTHIDTHTHTPHTHTHTHMYNACAPKKDV